MPSRRRFIVVCSAAMGPTAGCLEAVTRPDIPRETKILDERTTITPGDYRAWELTQRVRNASLTPVDEGYLFSYEFTVERGPEVTLAVTSPEALRRREESGGQYKVILGTRTHGQQGAIRERIRAELLELLVADTRYVGPASPTPGRGVATIHVEAYLSTPEPN